MKGLTLPKEESEAERDQTKENWTSEKVLATILSLIGFGKFVKGTLFSACSLI